MNSVVEDNRISKGEYETLINLTKPFVADSFCAKSTSAMQELLGILKGIGVDKRVNAIEADRLRDWVESNINLIDKGVASQLTETLNDVLEDGIITYDEESRVLELFESLINPSTTNSVAVEGKVFCLSGDFTHGSKQDVKAHIEALGGTCSNNVTRKTDYVVVGDEGSERFAFGHYGTKVKKAMELQQSGLPISVIQESALFAK